MFLLALQSLHLAQRRFQATAPLACGAASGSGLALGYLLFVRRLRIQDPHLLARQCQMRFDLLLTPKRVAAGIGFDLGAIQRHPFHGNQPLGTQHAEHLHKQIVEPALELRAEA